MTDTTKLENELNATILLRLEDILEKHKSKHSKKSWFIKLKKEIADSWIDLATKNKPNSPLKNSFDLHFR